MPDSLDAAREAMIERHLRARGILNPRVLEAMRRVPREAFVHPADAAAAYEDRALGIGHSQTISQPYIVALMTDALDLRGGERVLEIGTGSGYQAAVLAAMGAEVFTIERHAPLAEIARERLNRLGVGGVHVRVGDGRLGWPEEAPFDRVIITAATDEIPPAVWEQLAEGGVAVAPLGTTDEQILQQVRKIGGRPMRQPLVGCRFVPLLPNVATEDEG